MENWTYSDGSQRGLDRLPGGNADCGQHAAGGVSGCYFVGSVSVTGGIDQVPAIRHPIQFEPSHGRSAPLFRVTAVPPNAQAVAFVEVFPPYWFHYARIEAGNLSQTDANQSTMPGMGGAYCHFAPSGGQYDLSNLRGRRGVQQVQVLRDVGDFVDYCAAHYNTDVGLFYFCKFG